MFLTVGRGVPKKWLEHPISLIVNILYLLLKKLSENL